MGVSIGLKCPNCGYSYEHHQTKKNRAPDPKAVARLRKQLEREITRLPVEARKRVTVTDQDLQLWAEATAEDERDLPKVLFPEFMSEGIALSWRNSQQFVRDAEMLYNNGSFGHALALSLFAIEEAGKMVNLKIRKDSGNAIGRRLYKHIFRIHGFKIFFGLWRSLTTKAIEDFKTTKSYDEFETSAALSASLLYKASTFKTLREDGLYVDFDPHDGRWSSPFGKTIEDQAQEWLKIGQAVVNYIDKTWTH